MTRRPHSRWHDVWTLAAALIALLIAAAWCVIAAHLDPAPVTSLPVPSVTPTERLSGQPSRDTARTTPPTPQVVVRATPTPAAGSRTGKPEPVAGLSATIDDALACIRAHESDTAGGYTAVNPSSGAAGAYQLMPEWSDDWAVRYGHPEWANVTADQWPPAVQDSVAAQLYTDNPAAWQGSGC